MLKENYLPFSTFLVMGLATGICFADLKFWLLFFIVISLIFFIFKKISSATFNLLLISMLVGCYLHQRQVETFHNFKNQVNHKVFDVIGTVVDYEKSPENLFKYRLTIQTKTFSNAHENFNCTKSIYIYTQRFPKAYLGELLLFKNLKFNLTNNNHFERFLIKNKIAATIFIGALISSKVTDIRTDPLIFLKKYKRRLLKKINFKMNQKTGTMFNSIFLGNKSYHKSEIAKLKHNFQTWGIIHYLARSGLHLVIISTIWQFLCNILQIPCLLSNIIILLFMLAFSLLSWSALPFARALIMITGYRMCRFLTLQVHLLHLLNISCIITLLNNPTSIFFLDFQLSFLLTYGLIFLNESSHMQNKPTPKHSIAYKN